VRFHDASLRALHRIYGDVCLPSRINEYRDLLQCAIDQGYETHSLHSFWSVAKSDTISASKFLVIRHDVDISASSARRMWEVEQKLNVLSSYYFRLRTIDIGLVKEMHFSGFEASYHYEELSSVAKIKGITRREQVQQEMPYIRALFTRNLLELRFKTGLPMRTVAAHGDFVNSKLDLRNTAILEDENLRKEVGVDLEAYDDAVMRHVVGRYSDATREYPRLWASKHPASGFRIGENVIYLLIHPEGWISNARANLVDDFRRLRDEFAYFLAVRKHRYCGMAWRA